MVRKRWGEKKNTGLEERTVEEKRPREGRLERNLEAPLLGDRFESDGGEDEPSIETRGKNTEERKWEEK